MTIWVASEGKRILVLWCRYQLTFHQHHPPATHYVISMLIHHKRQAMVSISQSFTSNNDVYFLSERLNRKQHSLYQLNNPSLPKCWKSGPSTLRPFNISASGNPTGLLIRHSSVIETILHIKIRKFPHVCKNSFCSGRIYILCLKICLYNSIFLFSACWNCDKYIPTWNT